MRPKILNQLGDRLSPVTAMQRAAGSLTRLSPRRTATGVEVEHGIPYVPGSTQQRVNIYRPRGRTDTLPVMLYVHGGGFHMLSKDTHWPLTTAFARRGMLVVSVDYRLAPQHPFPAAIQDVCTAAVWVRENIHRYGGDPDNIVLAGESAGGNLVTALTIAATFERPELYARKVMLSGFRPRAVIAACGMLQVSDPGRFRRRKQEKLPGWANYYIHQVSGAYLDGALLSPGQATLADPLLLLERDERPRHALPPFFAFAGTKDPLLEDTRRLEQALARRGVPCEARVYPGGLHAFHVLLFQKIARDCWRHQFAFLDRHVPRQASGPGRTRWNQNRFAESGS